MIEVLVTSSVLILVLAALRRALRGRLSLRVQYALWLLVAVRLLIPVSLFSSPFSVMHAVEPVADTLRADWTQQRQPTAPIRSPRVHCLSGQRGGPCPLYPEPGGARRRPRAPPLPGSHPLPRVPGSGTRKLGNCGPAGLAGGGGNHGAVVFGEQPVLSPGGCAGGPGRWRGWAAFAGIRVPRSPLPLPHRAGAGKDLPDPGLPHRGPRPGAHPGP